MRVTNEMISSQVVFNMQRSIKRFSNLQSDMSSGRRINRPSDDPLGTLRDLNYRSEITMIAQYRKNISQGLKWANTYDSVLSDAKEFIDLARTDAVLAADDTMGTQERLALASGVQSYLDQLIQLSNQELEGQRVFAGFRTTTVPFVNAGNGVTYEGDQGQIQFEIESSSLMPVNMDGSSVFLKRLSTLGENADLNVGIVAGTATADLNGGNGIDSVGQFNITDRNSGITVTVDISGQTDIGQIIAKINSDIAAGFPGTTSLVARIGDEGNNITFDAADDGLISSNTLLSKLNNGTGVDLTPGTFQITVGGTIDVEIDLSGLPPNPTIGDVIAEFESQLDAAAVTQGIPALANVTMSINAANTGLDINDPGGLGLAISDLNPSDSTAMGLGIVGNVDTILAGQALNPVNYFEITELGAGTAGADLGLLGDFSTTKVGDDLDPQLTATDRLSDLKNGLGLDGGSITIHEGAWSQDFDFDDPSLTTVQDFLDAINNSGLAITASINSGGKGIQIINNDETRSLVIEETTTGRAAKEMGLYGSSDIFGTLVALRNALEKDDPDGVRMLIGNLEDALEHLLNQRATAGANAVRLETTDTRLVNSDLNFISLLAEVEDADLSRLAVDLATFENNYQASLISAARIIQPTLLDFLK